MSVYLNIDKGNNVYEQSESPVWNKKYSHGNHWIHAQVYHDGLNQSVSNFIIEALTRDSFYNEGDIALGKILSFV